MSRVPKKSNPEKVVQDAMVGTPPDVIAKKEKVKKETLETLPKKEKVKKEAVEALPKKEKVKKEVAEALPKKEKVSKEVVVEEVKSDPEVVCDTPMESEFDVLLTQVQLVTLQMNSIKNAIKTLEKKTSRDLKHATKSKKKSKALRKPSGFVKPARISNELATFLNQPPGTELARTEVTKVINAYIRANNLQDPSNGRIILPDPKLSDLLNVKKEDELTYFNLQRYMSPHFAKQSDVKVNV